MDNIGIDSPEEENEVIQDQPIGEVKAQVEEAEPDSQGDDTDQEFFVDTEGDGHKTSKMSKEDAHAAFLREKRKRKDKQKQIDAEKERYDKLEAEYRRLSEVVGEIKRGGPPTLESCGYDEEALNLKMKEYYSEPKREEPKPQEKTSSPADDESEFYLYQKELDLAKSVPSYHDAKESAIGALEAAGITDTDGAFLYLSGIARQKNVDIAKVVMAIGKVPSIVDEIKRAGNNQILIADILAEAESKIKTRAKKPIDAQPEPNINNSGPIDNRAAKVAKLRDAWVANPTARNYDIYQAAKIGN